METSPVNRRLAAILAADVAGYTRLVAVDEEGTLRTLASYRATISDLVADHRGRIFATAGDSVVVEFASAVQAVRAAVAIQRALHRHNADLPSERRLAFRIGINVGDVIAEGDDLLGDGVNVAARLQEIADPGGICLTAAVQQQIEGKHDFRVSPLGERALKNIPRPVSVFRVDWTAEVPVTRPAGGQLALPDKPSIAVLPFNNMSGDAEQEYFADGITEDIVTALSRYRWFFVIARNSSFAYKGRAVDVKQVGRELGVRYVLEGSVRRSGNRVRATAQLIEAETGNHLWAERFDRDLADIFALQDEITQSVVAAIEPEMLIVEGRRAARKNPANLDAFDHAMRGIWHFNLYTPDNSRQAETWLKRAIDLDPDLALATLYLTRVLNSRIWWGWSTEVDVDVTTEYAAAKRAVALDERDPYCHYAMFLASMLTLRHEQALAEAQRAIDLNPNFHLGYFALGWIRIFMGRAAEALDPLLRSQRLNPNDPQVDTYLGQTALAYYHLGRYDDAVGASIGAMRNRRHPFALRTMIASLGQLGRVEEARSFKRELDAIDISDRKRYFEITSPYADPALAAKFKEGLTKAGVKL